MSSELLKMAEGFSMVAESLRSLAGQTEMVNPCTDRAEDTMQKKQADIAKANAQEKKVTVEQIRAVLAEKSQDGKTVQIKELLKKYGAVKLSAVEEKDYSALFADAEKL
jgi:predicted HTH transcriptional regulator